jgi:hypothetical protein
MLTLVKFESLKALLDLSKDSIDDYPSLKLLVSSVYAAIESYLGRTLEQGEYTETVFVEGRMIPLKAIPVISFSSVFTEDDEELAEKSKIRNDHVVMESRYVGNVAVTYTGGYEEAPDQITRAALLQISHEWQRRDNIGATLATTEGGSTNWPELSLLKEVRRMLDPFVHSARMI